MEEEGQTTSDGGRGGEAEGRGGGRQPDDGDGQNINTNMTQTDIRKFLKPILNDEDKVTNVSDDYDGSDGVRNDDGIDGSGVVMNMSKNDGRTGSATDPLLSEPTSSNAYRKIFQNTHIRPPTRTRVNKFARRRNLQKHNSGGQSGDIRKFLMPQKGYQDRVNIEDLSNLPGG